MEIIAKNTAPADIPLRALGASGISFPALGVGTNRWGTSSKGIDALLPVFRAALDSGCNLLDTAEMYQFKGAERVVGECMRGDHWPVQLVTKFEPYPTRFSPQSFRNALDGSLKRLGVQSVDLYLIHFPFNILSIESLMDLLAEAVGDGKARAVGVSNFSAEQMLRAAKRLERHGVPLAANEVHYSLFHREPERNGVLGACRIINAALIAYRPVEGGQVTSNHSMVGKALEEIAHAREKTTAQVALNWLLRKDERIIAIPGTTNAAHLRENAGAAGWSLSDEEMAILEKAAL